MGWKCSVFPCRDKLLELKLLLTICLRFWLKTQWGLQMMSTSLKIFELWKKVKWLFSVVEKVKHHRCIFKKTVRYDSKAQLQNNETQYSKIMRALINFSSSHQKCFVKKGVLKNFANFTGNQFNFPVEFAKFLRTPILKNICKLVFLKLGEVT